jgi:NDP-sugar pyrophosphorylase family protein
MNASIPEPTNLTSNLSAAILAGGFGTRLQPVVSDKPKIMADVRGRPFITYLLDQLADLGINEVVLCLGYMAQTVIQSLGQSYGSMQLRYSVEDKPAGTGGAIGLAKSLFTHESVLVMNGDSYFNTNLNAFVRWCFTIGAKTGILLAQVKDTTRYGSVDLDANGVITAFKEKITSKGDGWINAGIYMLAREVVDLLPSGDKYSLERQLFPALIGKSLFGFRAEGRFIDIGTPESYAIAHVFFAGNHMKGI